MEAINWAWEQITDKKRTLDIILGAHRILMTGIAEGGKTPGKFRDTQNAIIGRAAFHTRIVYIPPPESLSGLLRNLEDFCNDEHDNMPVLVQCAMVHYQFEAIRPFKDGNGRIGRLLVLLLLRRRGLLAAPLLCMSAFFDRYKLEYYDRLLEVSRKSDWGSRLKFFLRALAAQAAETIAGIKRPQDLRHRYRRMLRDAGANANAFAVADSLFRNPHVAARAAQRLLGMSYATAKRSIGMLVEAGILTESGARYKSRIYVALDIYGALRGAEGDGGIRSR